VHIVIIYVRYVTLVVSFLGHRLKRTGGLPAQSRRSQACLSSEVTLRSALPWTGAPFRGPQNVHF
jgi:hypothetical protein